MEIKVLEQWTSHSHILQCEVEGETMEFTRVWNNYSDNVYWFEGCDMLNDDWAVECEAIYQEWLQSDG